MARQTSGALLPGLNLLRDSRAPISKQLFQELREVVLSGRLKPGTRMPATRNLAHELGVSRTTVAQAYEQLKSEGYLVGREKSGTFIPEVLPSELSRITKPASPDDGGAPAAAPRLSRQVARTAPAKPERGVVAQPFHPGIPSIAEFPEIGRAHV